MAAGGNSFAALTAIAPLQSKCKRIGHRADALWLGLGHIHRPSPVVSGGFNGGAALAPRILVIERAMGAKAANGWIGGASVARRLRRNLGGQFRAHLPFWGVCPRRRRCSGRWPYTFFWGGVGLACACTQGPCLTRFGPSPRQDQEGDIVARKAAMSSPPFLSLKVILVFTLSSSSTSCSQALGSVT